MKRNLSLYGKLLICRNVTHEIDHAAGTVRTSVVLEPRAEGPDGIQGNYPVSYPAPALRQPDWTPGGSPFTLTYAYMAGGYSGIETAVTDRLTIATETNAANAGSALSVARRDGTGLSDCRQYAYISGGVNSGSSDVNTTDRITLSTSIAAAYATGNLLSANSGMMSISASVGAYLFVGGGGPAGAPIDTVDKLTITTGVFSAHGTMTAGARTNRRGLSDGVTYGYWTGINLTPSSERLLLSTGVMSVYPSADFTGWWEWPGAYNGSNAGYAAGGDASGSVQATCEKIDFSTGVASTIGGTLNTARYGPGVATNKTTYGYLAGGWDGGSRITTAEKMSYSSETFSLVASADLPTATMRQMSATDGWV